MSLRSHQFLRPCLNGLSSAQCSNAGRWYRGLGPHNDRYGVQRASTHSTHGGQTQEPVSEEHDLATPAWSTSETDRNPSSNSASRSRFRQNGKARKTRARTQAEDIRDESEVANSTIFSRRGPGQSRSPSTPLLSIARVRQIMQSQGHNVRHAPTVQRRLNAEIQAQNRFLKDKDLYLATVIRSNSLYQRELGLRQWKAAYEAIYKARHYGREVLNKAVLLALKEKGQELAKKVQDDCHGSFRRAWRAMQRHEKAMFWQRLAIWLLQNDPRSFLEFLIVTTESQEKPDFTMVVDCLLYMDNFYYADWLKDWKSGAHTYESLIETCLHPGHWPIISLPQKGVRLYIRRAGLEAVALALRLVRERSIQVTAETALCFMWRFTKLGDVKSALDALGFIPFIKDPKFPMDSEGVLRHCCKLLTLDSVQDGIEGRNFRILPRLLELGVRPDRDMMNVVLSNAFKTGDPQLGADMLQFMKSHGHEFDSYTYVTLLTDAVARGDRGRAEVLFREVGMQEELRKNPYIASKIFHSHFVFTVKNMDADADPSGVFYSMLDMYNAIHDITPLKELFIISPHYTPRAGGANTPPSHIALYLMIATYFRCQNRLATVQRIYNRFHELVTQGHPTIAPLAETDHTYNEFLIALRGNPRGLRSCVRLVEDMLHSAIPPDSSSGKAITPVKPTMRTWTLLLSAFIYNRQPLAAEKIKEMMAKHKVKYNDVTWNTIVNGYANAQNIPETAASIKAMEEAGFPIDTHTMKSLRYLHDPERLWVALSEIDRRATEGGLQQDTPRAEPETQIRRDQKQREKLLDGGLQKLGEKSKPKP